MGVTGGLAVRRHPNDVLPCLPKRSQGGLEVLFNVHLAATSIQRAGDEPGELTAALGPSPAR
jgi:hypothetical protein